MTEGQPQFGVGTDGIVRGGVQDVEAWLAGLDELVSQEMAREITLEIAEEETAENQKCPFDE